MKAALYLRVSTEDQRERQSIDNQRDFARRYCELHEIEVYAEYADDGFSGTTPIERRPAGSRLLEDARLKKFDTVLIYRIDRLARSTLHLLNGVEALEAAGVALRSMSEPFDTGTAVGKFILTVLASIAALERDTLRERSGMGMERTAREGRWNGGKAPFGYKVVNRRLEIETETAEVVSQVFALYLEGKGTTWIADHLTAHKVPQPRARQKKELSGRWAPSSVSKLLNNRTYIGKATWRRRHIVTTDGKNPRYIPAELDKQIEFDVPRIISDEDFARVQSLLEANMTNASRNRKRFYPLRRLVFCGKPGCGRRFIGGGSQRDQNFYYTCSTHTIVGAQKCGSRKIRAEILEEAVWSRVAKLLEDPKAYADQAFEGIKGVQVERKQVLSTQEQIAQLIKEKLEHRGRVIKLRMEDLITEEEAAKQLNPLRKDIEQLERERDEEFLREGEIVRKEAQVLGLEAQLRELAKSAVEATSQVKAAILAQLIEKVTVFVSEAEISIEITYLNGVASGLHRSYSSGWGNGYQQCRSSDAFVIRRISYLEREGLTPDMITTSVAAGKLGITQRQVLELIVRLGLNPKRIGRMAILSSADMEKLAGRKTSLGPAKGYKPKG